MALCYVTERAFTIERDMGWVILIVPGRKSRLRANPLGHHHQKPPSLQHSKQLYPNCTSPVYVLNDFRTGNEIIGFVLEHTRILSKARVVHGHRETVFLEHCSQGRAGAAAEVEARRGRSNAFDHGVESSRQETAIAKIIHGIAMQSIFRVLCG